MKGRSSRWPPESVTQRVSISSASHHCSSGAVRTGRNMKRTRPLASGSIADACSADERAPVSRSEEHTSELQSLMRISYAVFCLKKKKQYKIPTEPHGNG